MGKLDGKVAVVTGTARGIGKATAQLFAAEGARVVCVDRDLKEGDHPFFEGSAETTVSEIQAAGGTALAIQTDVSREEDCDNAVAKTNEAFGPIDVLVNNAAYTIYTPVKDFPIRKWFRSCAVNVHGPFMMSQKVLPDMIERHSGAILNISSAAAIGPGRGPYKETPALGRTMYGAEKAAIERFTQGLAEEVYQYGISVTSLAPSKTVNTPGTKYLGTSTGPDDPKGEPMDYMARAALILVTEPLDKITGCVTYSQALLKEHGLIAEGEGPGIERPGSGYSQT